MRIFETHDAPHLSFVVIWLASTFLALAWNSRVAAHFVALASLPWWITTAFLADPVSPYVLTDGAALLFGAGLALAAAPWQRASSAGSVLSTYGALSLAGVAILEAATANEVFRTHAGVVSHPLWSISCGIAGAIFAFGAAATTRRAGAAFAGSAIGLVLLASAVWTPPHAGEPWRTYALTLCAMLCLVASGMLDAARPRIVAGWLGIAGVIAAITWTVKGSLLQRSMFLAAAGLIAVALALVLNRFLPRTRE